MYKLVITYNNVDDSLKSLATELLEVLNRGAEDAPDDWSQEDMEGTMADSDKVDSISIEELPAFGMEEFAKEYPDCAEKCSAHKSCSKNPSSCALTESKPPVNRYDSCGEYDRLPNPDVVFEQEAPQDWSKEVEYFSRSLPEARLISRFKELGEISSFAEAVPYLLDGDILSRRSWDGYEIVYLVKGAIAANKSEKVNPKLYDTYVGEITTRTPRLEHHFERGNNRSTMGNWIPNMEELLARDWMVYSEV